MMRTLPARLAALAATLWYGFGARAVLAQGDIFGQNQLEGVGRNVYGSNLEGQSLPVLIGNLIRVLLGMLGLVFLVLMVYAGYKWLIARGDKQHVQDAKDTITRALIGLVIVIAAYAIASFVIASLTRAATPNSGPLAPL